MDAGMFGTWIAVGLLTGWLAGVVLKDGGQGLWPDLALALTGSSLASTAAAGLGLVHTASATAAIVAFLGAVAVIVAQRTFWHARA